MICSLLKTKFTTLPPQKKFIEDGKGTSQGHFFFIIVGLIWFSHFPFSLARLGGIVLTMSKRKQSLVWEDGGYHTSTVCQHLQGTTRGSWLATITKGV